MPHRMNIMDNWDQVRGVMKHQHPVLTDDDLFYEQGKEDELYERISRRIQLSPEHTRAFIERLHQAL
jgi:hypothetical protein